MNKEQLQAELLRIAAKKRLGMPLTRWEAALWTLYGPIKENGGN